VFYGRKTFGTLLCSAVYSETRFDIIVHLLFVELAERVGAQALQWPVLSPVSFIL